MIPADFHPTRFELTGTLWHPDGRRETFAIPPIDGDPIDVETCFDTVYPDDLFLAGSAPDRSPESRTLTVRVSAPTTTSCWGQLCTLPSPTTWGDPVRIESMTAVFSGGPHQATLRIAGAGGELVLPTTASVTDTTRHRHNGSGYARDAERSVTVRCLWRRPAGPMMTWTIPAPGSADSVERVQSDS